MSDLRRNQRDKIIVGLIFTLFSAVFLGCKINSGKFSNESIDFKPFLQHSETLKKASAENIRGDFENKNSFEFAGVKAAMSIVSGEYFVKFERGGRTENYKIAAVVGDRRVEEYVAESGGEFLRLPIGYDLRNNRWTNLNEIYFDPGDEDFFKHQKNWKADCAACHLAGENLTTKNSQTANAAFAAHPKNLSDLSSDASLLACAGCHAKDLTDSMPNFEQIALSENLVKQTVSAHQTAPQNASHFFADGSVRLTAHEYQGVLRSVCYVKSKADGTKIGGEKINCLSCHTPNQNGSFDVQTDEKLHTNQICTSCHQQFADEKSVAEHTKHLSDSEVNSCAACHQAEIVYGNLSFQKTHEISVPNPELTALKQVPNACNQCHADKSVNWAITQTKNLWTEHFRDAKISSDWQFDQPEGARGLFGGDAFTRALTANNLAKHSDLSWSKPFLFRALETENYPLVKFFLTNALRDSGEGSTANNFLFAPHKTDFDEIIRRLRRKRPANDIEIPE